MVKVATRAPPVGAHHAPVCVRQGAGDRSHDEAHAHDEDPGDCATDDKQRGTGSGTGEGSGQEPG